MDVFEQLKQEITHFDTCFTLLDAADREVRDILTDVQARIGRDKAAHAERVKALTAQSVNPSRSVVLRELSARELEQIKGQTFSPSEAETAAFNTSMDAAREALREAARARGRIDDLFAAAKEELKKLRTAAHTGRDPMISERVLNSKWDAFQDLIAERDEGGISPPTPAAGADSEHRGDKWVWDENGTLRKVGGGTDERQEGAVLPGVCGKWERDESGCFRRV